MPLDVKALIPLIGSLRGNPGFLRGYQVADEQMRRQEIQNQQLQRQQQQDELQWRASDRADAGLDMDRQRLALQIRDQELQEAAIREQGLTTLEQQLATLENADDWDNALAFGRNMLIQRGVDPGVFQSRRFQKPPIEAFNTKAARKALEKLPGFDPKKVDPKNPIFKQVAIRQTTSDATEPQEPTSFGDLAVRAGYLTKDPATGEYYSFTQEPAETSRDSRSIDVRIADAAASGNRELLNTLLDAKRQIEAVGQSPLDDKLKQAQIAKIYADIASDKAAATAKKDGEPSAYSTERAVRAVQSVDELLAKVSGKTTGWGALMGGVPGSDALAFASELETLKASIAFNELTAMREASKTGGALGQVSDREAALLSNALGALNPKQSPGQIRSQLNKIKQSLDRWHVAQTGKPVPRVAGGEPAPTSGDGWVTMGDGTRVRVKAP